MALALFASISVAQSAPPPRSEVSWHAGPFESALAEAKASSKLVFVDFGADWCKWCKKLEAESFPDAKVASELAQFVALHVDVDSKDGRPIAERYRVGPLPTLDVLEADGKLRDVLTGYLPPARLAAELARIRRDEGTIGALERGLAKSPRDLDLQLAYGAKMQLAQDYDALERCTVAVAEIDRERHDPRTSPFLWKALVTGVEGRARRGEIDGLPARIEAWLARETDETNLYQGWLALAQLRTQIATQARKTGDAESGARNEAASWVAQRRALEHVPDLAIVNVARKIAATAWEQRESASPELRAFAGDVARKYEPKALDVRDADMLHEVARLHFVAHDVESAKSALARAKQIAPGDARIADWLREIGG